MPASARSRQRSSLNTDTDRHLKRDGVDRFPVKQAKHHLSLAFRRPPLHIGGCARFAFRGLPAS